MYSRKTAPMQFTHTKASFATVSEESETDEKFAAMANIQRSNLAVQPRMALERPCLYCRDRSHALEDCKTFTDLPMQERIGLCFGCLRSGHQKRNCRMKVSCKQCERNHPTVLHDEQRIEPQKSENRDAVSSSGKNLLNACANISLDVDSQMEAGECTMAIVPVMVKTKNDNLVKTYAFLDPGSTVSFASERLIKQLGIGGKTMRITLDTMGVPHVMDTTVISGIQVCNLEGGYKVLLKKVYSKKQIPVSHRHIPTSEDISQWPHLKEVNLPQIDAGIKLLIGNEVADAYSPLQVLTGPPGSPHAVKSRVEWIVWNVVRDIGAADDGPKVFPVNIAKFLAIQDAAMLRDLDQMVRSAMHIDFTESIIDDKRESSQEDKQFMEKVNKSISRIQGHYQIDLPFRCENVQIPNNMKHAVQRLKSLEKRLRSNPAFYEDYNSFMSDIITKGYAERVPEKEMDRDDVKVWYIPHHGTYHSKKPQKIRVVFDCSAKFNGVSLNDLLLQGPDLTNHLIGVLIRFRQEPVALMADVETMFHQVRVEPNNRDCLRFLWWRNGNLNKQPEIYRIVVHPFGVVSSPSCSNFALRTTAEDNREEFGSEVVNTVLNNFYVDDCLMSVKSEAEAVTLVNDLSALCLRGGFRLTKWVSNSIAVLQTIPKEEQAKEMRDLDLDCEELPSVRALGVCWLVEVDKFEFKITLTKRPPTRRGILSLVSSIFDPLGLVTPYCLTARALLQDLCMRRVGWDEPLDCDDLQRWLQWQTGLMELEGVTINR